MMWTIAVGVAIAMPAVRFMARPADAMTTEVQAALVQTLSAELPSLVVVPGGPGDDPRAQATLGAIVMWLDGAAPGVLALHAARSDWRSWRTAVAAGTAEDAARTLASMARLLLDEAARSEPETAPARTPAAARPLALGVDASGALSTRGSSYGLGVRSSLRSGRLEITARAGVDRGAYGTRRVAVNALELPLSVVAARCLASRWRLGAGIDAAAIRLTGTVRPFGVPESFWDVQVRGLLVGGVTLPAGGAAGLRLELVGSAMARSWKLARPGLTTGPEGPRWMLGARLAAELGGSADTKD